jgi:hypothetical protein
MTIRRYTINLERTQTERQVVTFVADSDTMTDEALIRVAGAYADPTRWSVAESSTRRSGLTSDVVHVVPS